MTDIEIALQNKALFDSANGSTIWSINNEKEMQEISEEKLKEFVEKINKKDERKKRVLGARLVTHNTCEETYIYNLLNPEEC